MQNKKVFGVLLILTFIIFVVGYFVFVKEDKIKTPIVNNPDAGNKYLNNDKSDIPLDINLVIGKEQIKVGEEMQLTFIFVPRFFEIPYTIGKLKSNGVAVLKGETEKEWGSVAAEKEVRMVASFYIKEPGEGEIIASVIVNDGENINYGKSTAIYFFATEQGEVLTSTVSPWTLKRDYLYREMKEGRIKSSEYESFLGGGAKEESSLKVIK